MSSTISFHVAVLSNDTSSCSTASIMQHRLNMHHAEYKKPSAPFGHESAY